MEVMGILTDWGVTLEELEGIVDANPSLRSFVGGYVAESRWRDRYFAGDPRVTDLDKADDHDRTRKGDLSFRYRGEPVVAEGKSIQTNSIRHNADGSISAVAQVDASDRRPVTFDDGSSVETTCLRVGEFDLLVVNLFPLLGRWEFAFALNRALPRVAPRGRAKSYTDYQRDNLLATTVPVTWPLAAPFSLSPWPLIDQIILDRRDATPATPPLADPTLF